MERLTIPDEPIESGMRRTIIDARAVREEAMTVYWRLKRYEDTGLMPEQIKEMDRVCLEKCREVTELKKQLEWIPVAERLPEPATRVLVTIKHHSWIADPGHHDQTKHPEWTESCEARYLRGKEWEYADRECEYELTSAFSNLGQSGEAIFGPFDEVLAWMPIPETWKEGEEGGKREDYPLSGKRG